MLPYRKIPFWINKSRLRFLNNFRNDLESYFSNTSTHWMADSKFEEPEAEEARVKINRNMDAAYHVIVSSGVNPTLIYTPPPAIGGYIQHIDVIHNIFNIDNYDIPPQSIFDFIDRAIGIYEKNHIFSVVRTFNPFFWFGEIISFISGIPFRIIGQIGFDQEKAEQSFIGKIFKAILYFFTLLASILTVLQLLGLLNPLKEFFKKTFKI